MLPMNRHSPTSSPSAGQPDVSNNASHSSGVPAVVSSGPSSTPPSAPVSSRGSFSSERLLKSIEETSDLLRTFRQLKERGASREELAVLHARVRRLKESQTRQAAAGLLGEPVVATRPATTAAYAGVSAPQPKTTSTVYYHNPTYADPDGRLLARAVGAAAAAAVVPGATVSSLHASEARQHRHHVHHADPVKDVRPFSGRAPPQRSSERLPSRSSREERADAVITATVPSAVPHEDGDRAWRLNGTSATTRTAAATTTDAATAALRTAPPTNTAITTTTSSSSVSCSASLHSIIFAIVLAESHTRCEIAHKWERRLLRYWADFKEDRVAIALRPPMTQLLGRPSGGPSFPTCTVSSHLHHAQEQQQELQQLPLALQARQPMEGEEMPRAEGEVERRPTSTAASSMAVAQVQTPSAPLPVPTVPVPRTSELPVPLPAAAIPASVAPASPTAKKQAAAAEDREAARVQAGQQAAEKAVARIKAVEKEEAEMRLRANAAEEAARQKVEQGAAAEAARLKAVEEEEAARLKAEHDATEARHRAEDDEAAARQVVEAEESDARRRLDQQQQDSRGAAAAAEAERQEAEQEAARAEAAARAKAEKEASDNAARAQLVQNELAERAQIKEEEKSSYAQLCHQSAESEAAALSAAAEREARVQAEQQRVAEAEVKAAEEALRAQKERSQAVSRLDAMAAATVDAWVGDAAMQASAKAAEQQRRAKEEKDAEDRRQTAERQREEEEAARLKAEHDATEARHRAEDDEAAARQVVEAEESDARRRLDQQQQDSRGAAAAAEAERQEAEQEAARAEAAARAKAEKEASDNAARAQLVQNELAERAQIKEEEKSSYAQLCHQSAESEAAALSAAAEREARVQAEQQRVAEAEVKAAEEALRAQKERSQAVSRLDAMAAATVDAWVGDAAMQASAKAAEQQRRAKEEKDAEDRRQTAERQREEEEAARLKAEHDATEARHHAEDDEAAARQVVEAEESYARRRLDQQQQDSRGAVAAAEAERQEAAAEEATRLKAQEEAAAEKGRVKEAEEGAARVGAQYEEQQQQLLRLSAITNLSSSLVDSWLREAATTHAQRIAAAKSEAEKEEAKAAAVRERRRQEEEEAQREKTGVEAEAAAAAAEEEQWREKARQDVEDAQLKESVEREVESRKAEHCAAVLRVADMLLSQWVEESALQHCADATSAREKKKAEEEAAATAQWKAQLEKETSHAESEQTDARSRLQGDGVAEREDLVLGERQECDAVQRAMAEREASAASVAVQGHAEEAAVTEAAPPSTGSPVEASPSAAADAKEQPGEEGGVSSVAYTTAASTTSSPCSSFLASPSSAPSALFPRLPAPGVLIWFADEFLAHMLHDAAEKIMRRYAEEESRQREQEQPANAVVAAHADACEGSAVRPLDDVARRASHQQSPGGASVTTSARTSPSVIPLASPASVTRGSTPLRTEVDDEYTAGKTSEPSTGIDVSLPSPRELAQKPASTDNGADRATSSTGAHQQRQTQLSPHLLQPDALQAVTNVSTCFSSSMRSFSMNSSSGEDDVESPSGPAQGVRQPLNLTPPSNGNLSPLLKTANNAPSMEARASSGQLGVAAPSKSCDAIVAAAATTAEEEEVSGVFSESSRGSGTVVAPPSADAQRGDGASRERLDDGVAGGAQVDPQRAVSSRAGNMGEVDVSGSAVAEDGKAPGLDALQQTTGTVTTTPAAAAVTAEPPQLKADGSGDAAAAATLTVAALETASAHVIESLIHDAVRLLPSSHYTRSSSPKEHSNYNVSVNGNNSGSSSGNGNGGERYNTSTFSPERLDRVPSPSPSHPHLFLDAKEHADKLASGQSSSGSSSGGTGEEGEKHTDKKHSISELGPGFTKADAQETLPLSPSSSPSSTPLVGVPAVAPGAATGDARTDLASLTTLVTAVATPNDFVEQLRQQETAKKEAAYQQNRYLTSHELSQVAASYLTSAAAAAQVQELGPVEALTARAVALVLSVGLVHRVAVANRRARRRVEAAAAATAATALNVESADDVGAKKAGHSPAGAVTAAVKTSPDAAVVAIAETSQKALAGEEAAGTVLTGNPRDNPDGAFPTGGQAANAVNGNKKQGNEEESGEDPTPPSSPSLGGRHGFGGPAAGNAACGGEFPSGNTVPTALSPTGGKAEAEAEDDVEDPYHVAGAPPSIMSPSAHFPSFAQAAVAPSSSSTVAGDKTAADGAVSVLSPPPPPPPANSPEATSGAAPAADGTGKINADSGARRSLPPDWEAGLRGVAERIARDFMDYASRRILLGQGEGQSNQDHLRTSEETLHDALATVSIPTLFTQELRVRDVARLTSYYIDLALNGARDRADPHYAPAALGEHNVFGRRCSGDVDKTGGVGDVSGRASPAIHAFPENRFTATSAAAAVSDEDMLLMAGGNSTLAPGGSPSAFSPNLHPRQDTFLTAATAIHIRRAGLMRRVLEQCITNVMNDLVGDTVGWLGTVILQPATSSADGRQQ